MKHKIYIILLFFSYFSHYACAQDPVFSQFYHNKLYLNPAYAGADDKYDAHTYISYRNQWPDIPSTYVDYTASYDQKVDMLHGGIGIYIMNDVKGDGIMKDLLSSLIYAYDLKIARYTHIHAGFQASYFMRSLNSSKLQFADMFDYSSGRFDNTTSENIASRTSGTFDFSSSLLLKHWDHRHNSFIHFGAAVHHLTTPKLFQQHNLPRKYSLHLDYNFPITYNSLGFEEVRFNPFILYQQQAGTNILSVKGLFLFDSYSGGIGFRNNLKFEFFTFLFSVGINVQNLHIGYSYDLLPSKKDMIISKLGAHEVTFLINLQYKGNRFK